MDEVIVVNHLIATFGAVAVGTLCLLGGPIAPATAYEPQPATAAEDISRSRALSDFSSDWSGTDQYDLDEQIELRATLQGIDLPDDGVAVLTFTLDLPGTVLARIPGSADQLFHAVLQTAQEVKRKGLSRRSFGRGKGVLLRGWPASEANTSGSMMLVEEIQFDNGGRYRLHSDNPKMKKNRS